MKYAILLLLLLLFFLLCPGAAAFQAAIRLLCFLAGASCCAEGQEVECCFCSFKSSCSLWGLKIVSGPGGDGSPLSDCSEEQVKAAVCWVLFCFFFAVKIILWETIMQNDSWLLSDQSANQAADQISQISGKVPAFQDFEMSRAVAQNR